mmetsp:Transcript_15627/g.30534  ORF Transcript_15627/g.30534 Transcript_15627/m.30534 type:complete len:160 (-) Transcript_15627:3-482(-)
MLVPDHKKAFAEAYRVLKPGGLACIGVWGEESNTKLFNLFPRALKKIGVDRPENNTRSNHHLQKQGGDDGLRKMMKGFGFRRCTVFHVHNAVGCLDGKELTQKWLRCMGDEGLAVPVLAKLRETGKYELMCETMSALAEEILEAGQPIGLDVSIMIARK